MTKKLPSRLASDSNWIRTRKTILRRLKSQVNLHLGEEPPEIKRCRLQLERELSGRWKRSTKRALISAVQKTELIFGGDFHAYGQAQRTHLKIIKDLASETKPFVIALEAFSIETQSVVDDFLMDKITEKALLKRTKWKTNWGFPWENFKGLVHYAKANGYKILAVGTAEPKATLLEREHAAAAALQKYFESEWEQNASPQVYCVFGELHLGKNQLPQLTKQSFKKRAPSILTIHLNAENLYFALAEKGLENRVDVVSLNSDRFVVMASPPWVQWQSYLMYLENSLDRSLEDDDENATDLSEHLAVLIRFACDDLKIEVPSQDLAVYTAGDPLLWRKLNASLAPRELKIARELIESGRSFFIPQGELFYLSRLTINHAAELAGQYIHARLNHREQITWKMPRDFLAQIWIEAVGFFVSKLINHKRHSETLQDLENRLASLSKRDQGRDVLQIALEQRFNELWFFHRRKWRKTRIVRAHPLVRLEAARILGGMMGERLYLALRSRNISLQSILQWMQKRPTDEDFVSFYEELILRLGPKTGAPRTRKERL